jgi:TonB family protein
VLRPYSRYWGYITSTVNQPSPERPPLRGFRFPQPRRRLGSGAAFALVTHAAVIGLLVAHARRPESRLSAAPGLPGRRINFFALPNAGGPAAVDVQPPPRIVLADLSGLRHITLDLPPLDIPQAILAPPATVLGGGGGSPSGQGSARGAGPGAGPGSGTGGEGGYIVSAQPRRVIPRPPECMFSSASRGRIAVSFWVAADGQPTRVEVDPPPADEECRRAFVALMMETRFVPAMQRGQPVASVVSIRYTSSH